MSDYPSNIADKYVLRFPDGWRDVIKKEAAKERTSMNSFMLNALETAMRIKGVQLDATAQK